MSICLNISLPVSSIFRQPPPHLPPQADMGMTYSELSVIGRLRKISKCGPFSMFCKLIHTWKDALSPMEVSKQCGTFFFHVSVTEGAAIESLGHIHM